MTPQDLIAAFDTLAEAPDGVTRLRELVLQLAVRGKLVPQDPEDEPASVLLERIAAEKARLVRDDTGRRSKALPSWDQGDVPFVAPSGWSWVRFEDICTIGSGVTKGRKLAGRRVREFPYLRVANVQAGSLNLEVIKRIAIPPEEYDGYSLVEGDVLLTEGGDWDKLGRSAIWHEEIPRCIHQNHVFRARSVRRADVLPRWMSMFTNSPVGRDYFQSCSKQTTNLASINKTQLRACPFPIPPSAEQHRIVARVDELMGLLDRLEAARTARDTTRAAARDAALAALREADTPEEVEVAWNRFAERTDDLLCDPADIDPLRQAVLQLAVRGKLVPQNPEDEPASVLLERIAAEKARLHKQKVIRKPKELAPLKRGDVPFDVPDHWPVVPFGQVFATVFTGPFGTSLKKSEYVDGGTPAINPQNLRDGEIVPTANTCVGPATLKRLSTFKVRSRDLVVARRGEMGRCAMVMPDQDGWLCGTGSLVLRPPTDLHVPYAALFLRSPWTVARLSGDSVGSTMLNLNQRIMLNLPFGLPPLAEQHRIVARVDELMGLLDRLEARLIVAQASHGAFAGAAVHHLDA